VKWGSVIAGLLVGAVIGAVATSLLAAPTVVHDLKTVEVASAACRSAVADANALAQSAAAALQAKDGRVYFAARGLMLAAFRDGEQGDVNEFSNGDLRSLAYDEEQEKLVTSNWTENNAGDAWAKYGALDAGNHARECLAAP
jgi:gas vesicle protein